MQDQDIFDNTPDGADLLDRVCDHWGQFICTVSESDLHLLALWAVHTHFMDALYTTPRLQIDSPIPECGKTTVLEHLNRLSMRGCMMASIGSPAMMTRLLDAEMRTILIDEADRSLDPKREGVDELLAVINSGYKRGATRPVSVPAQKGGWVVKEMPTYAPVALAGNNPNLPDDTRSRIIRVLLLPDRAGTVEETDWEMIEQETEALHDEIAIWADSVRDHVRTERPDMPEGIVARFREKWSPLIRVAHAAGGDWPKRARELALADKREWEMGREDGMLHDKPSTVLIKHLREVWPSGEGFVPTQTLVSRLHDNFPDAWGPSDRYAKGLTAKRLGFLLVSSFKVHSEAPPERGGGRGYTLAGFAKAWQSMGIDPPISSSESSAPSASSAQEEPAGADWKRRPCAKCGNLALTKRSGELCQMCRLTP